jgi:hypothetical protein
VYQDDKIWRNSVFNPQKEVTDEETVKFLENMPALRSYSATPKTLNIVFDTLCECCRNVQSIDLHPSHCMIVSFMRKIIQHFLSIESLKVQLLPSPTCSEVLKFT